MFVITMKSHSLAILLILSAFAYQAHGYPKAVAAVSTAVEQSDLDASVASADALAAAGTDITDDLKGSETFGFGYYPRFYGGGGYGRGFGGYGYGSRWGYGYGHGYGGYGGYGGYYRRPILYPAWG